MASKKREVAVLDDPRLPGHRRNKQKMQKMQERESGGAGDNGVTVQNMRERVAVPGWGDPATAA